MQGHVAAASVLLSLGAAVDPVEESTGAGLVHAAVQGGSLDMVRLALRDAVVQDGSRVSRQNQKRCPE